jgi:hypothetical protein
MAVNPGRPQPSPARSSLITATVTTTAKPAAVTEPPGPPRIVIAT